MMGALLGAAIWLNTATWIGAPVSTTHSIVGGVMGGGIAADGWDIVSWGSVGNIALSWVISPMTGGLIAAIFLLTLKGLVFVKPNPLAEAEKAVRAPIAIMAWAFTTYLVMKGLKHAPMSSGCSS